MASPGNLGKRRKAAIDKINAVADVLGKRFGVDVGEIPVRAKRDPLHEQVFQLEVIAAFIEDLERKTKPKAVPTKKQNKGRV